MTERPTEMDLALDGIDQAFKDSVAQLTKNAESALTRDNAREGLIMIRRARSQMIEWMNESLPSCR